MGGVQLFGYKLGHRFCVSENWDDPHPLGLLAGGGGGRTGVEDVGWGVGRHRVFLGKMRKATNSSEGAV